jgi:16S rRNA (cytosine967-C5)-methyltransferase
LKIYRGNCNAVVDILTDVLQHHKHLGKTIELYLKNNKQWGARDRHFIAEHVFEIIRFLRYYAHLSGQDFSSVDINSRLLLAAKLLSEQIEIPDWFELEDNDRQTILLQLSEPATKAIRLSYTDWFFTEGENAYGKAWESLATKLNEQSMVCLRANTLKTSRQKLLKVLGEEGITVQKVDDCNDGMVLQQRQKLVNHVAYKEGLFEFQDISSQQVVEFCEPRPNTVVIDTCAGAGGKSLHFACLMQNKGQIVSFDIHENKILELRKRASRAGAKIVYAQVVDESLVAEYRLQGDIVLIDAPCSGSGVIRRNPENKWQLNAELLTAITKTQQQILDSYSTMVAGNGILVYATCSILPQENELQVQAFLQRNPGFTLIAEKSLTPGINTEYDGFYMAKLKRV